MKIGISFLGFGFVCTQVARYLLEERDMLKETYDIEFFIRKVFVRDISKMRNIEHDKSVYTNDPLEIINDLETSTFKSITSKEILIASLNGKVIKPVARLENKDDELFYYVGPCIMENGNSFTLASGINCKIRITSENTATMGYCGPGAGDRPTASAMMEDFMNLINEDFKLTKRMEHLFKDIKEVEGKKLEAIDKICFIEGRNDLNVILEDIEYKILGKEVLNNKRYTIVEISDIKEGDFLAINQRIDKYNKDNRKNKNSAKLEVIIPFVKQ